MASPSVFRYLFLFLIILVTVCESSKTDKADLDTLKQVHVLFRHGDRAPVHPYPKDPYNSHSYWPFGFGQLTKEGLQMQQKLGKWFRARYDGFLSKHWNHTEIKITTTDFDRTINSALANLQGLYFTQEADMKFDQKLNWSPVPVRALPHDSDALMNVDDSCPQVAVETKKVDEDPLVQELTAKCQPLLKLLTEKLGVKLTTLLDIDYAYDYFYIHELHHIPLPTWVIPHLPLMKEMSQFSFLMVAYSPGLKRLRGGPLIKKIIEDMEDKCLNKTLPKFMMYSGHDTTVAANLETLGVYNKISPPYASTVIYELHYIEGQYVVKLLYRNDSTIIHPPYPLNLPGCVTNCPLSQFKTLLTPILPLNHTQECMGSEQEITTNYLSTMEHTINAVKEVFNHNDTVCMVLSGVILVLNLMMLILLVSWKRRLNKFQEYSLLSPQE